MSLVMALNEHCPNTWHMLIERLIFLIKSGVQVSIRFLTDLKERAINPSYKNGLTALRGKLIS